MGEAEVVWEGVLERSGVTLRKSLEDPVRNPPMAKYELRSTRESVVPIRIVEGIPADLDPENVGFVSSAGRTEGWRIDGSNLVYEADLEPGETTRSAIAARGEDVDVIRGLAGDPRVFDVDERGPDGARSALQTMPARHSSEHDGVVAALVAELRSGNVPDDDLAVLQRVLERESDGVGVEARIEQLQSDVADLRAGRRAIREDIQEVDGRLAAIEQHDDALAALREDVADIEHELYRFEKTLNAHTADIRSLERTVERLEGKLPANLEAFGEFADAMRQAIEGIEVADEADDDSAESADHR